MDEAKSLVNMAVAAMFSAVILMCAVGLIYTGYTMWSLFSKQEQANMIMKEHAQFSAFDNTDVRGQELTSLMLETQGDPFVLVYEMENNANEPTLDYYSISAATTYTPMWNLSYETASNSTDNTVNTAWNLIKSKLQTDGNDATTISDYVTEKSMYFISWTGDSKLSDVTEAMKTHFITKGAFETTRMDDQGNYERENSYGKYHAFLVYDEGNSSDIVGIIAIKYNGLIGQNGGGGN